MRGLLVGLACRFRADAGGDRVNFGFGQRGVAALAVDLLQRNRERIGG